ncbi:hypothetical protein TNCV_175561 [Trichonephila clavipes]|nr:hypothetical protein TNCV_175561 [Trichonephila clavipes]
MSLVYADKPQTFNHLEDNIRCIIDDIRPQMLEKVIENWTSRLDYIRASRISHIPEIIFKIYMAVKELDQDFATITGKNISSQTAYRLLEEKAIFARWTVVCVFFAHPAKRLVSYAVKNICLG